MLSKKRRNQIFVEAFILTIFIYLFAIILNGYLDESRDDYLSEKFINSNLNKESFYVLNKFSQLTNNSCQFKKNLIFKRQKYLKSLGTDLSNLGNLFLDVNKEKALLKEREYYLIQIELYGYVNKFNNECNEKIIPLLYFFNSLDPKLDKQSLILEQFSLNQVNKSIVFSFDINYDKEPLLNNLRNIHNATFTPYVIIGNKSTRNLGADAENVISLNTLSVEFLRQRGELK